MAKVFRLCAFMMGHFIKHPIWWVGGWMFDVEEVDSLIAEFDEQERWR